MVIPALVYIFIAQQDPALADGWAIPMATDIAFALGIMALLSKQVPLPLKIFLLALAIIDDLGAIVGIAPLLLPWIKRASTRLCCHCNCCTYRIKSL